MKNIELIIRTIDKYLEENNLVEITAVEANRVLEKAKVFNDYPQRAGRPLRELLRANLIPTAEYRKKPENIRGHWFLHHS